MPSRGEHDEEDLADVTLDDIEAQVALALPEVSTIAMAIFLEGVAAAPCPPIKI